MTHKPFISIIIPAYNTEKYLDKCVASLCRQTFENFEAIIINDSSTDRTGRIADEWAQKDTRVRVIHTPNNGVAEARNIGLQNARGRYLGFVDSDDWVEPDMLEKLVEAAEKHTADIAICGHVQEMEEGVQMQSGEPVGAPAVWTSHQALVKLLIDYKIKGYLWDKIYSKELFDGVEFPTGHLFEDQRILPGVFEKASVVCYINEPLYHYIQRKESILGAEKFTTKVEYLHSQLNLFRYVRESGLFSGAERIVIRSCIGKNIIEAFPGLKNDPSPQAEKEAEKLLNDFKTCGFHHYQKNPKFYKIIFGRIKKWGMKML